jgi:hypothetical protein
MYDLTIKPYHVRLDTSCPSASLPARAALLCHASSHGRSVTEGRSRRSRDAPERPRRSDFLVLSRRFYPGCRSAGRQGRIIPFGISSGTLLEACSQITSWPPCLIARCAAQAPSAGRRGGGEVYEVASQLYRGRRISSSQIDPWSRVRLSFRLLIGGPALSAVAQHRLRSSTVTAKSISRRRAKGSVCQRWLL